MKKISRMSIPLAVFVMVLCIAVGVGAGNQKALSRAVATYCSDTAEMELLYNERRTLASNLLVLAERNVKDAPETAALSEAINAHGTARGMGEMAQADHTLAFATQRVIELINSKEDALAQDKKLAIGVQDDLTGKEKQLRRLSNGYNKGVAEVQDVYGRLPAKFLLGGLPEMYQ